MTNEGNEKLAILVAEQISKQYLAISKQGDTGGYRQRHIERLQAQYELLTGGCDEHDQ